ncbi:hypothetical protein ACNQGP_00625 [Flavobacterium sp. GT2N3]|uniref:hypothetical protein n=1 Tax=unclassified Flavobacterium TaxID=196869 RepID=UPI003AACE216
MSKISKNKELNDMQIHIDKAYDIITAHLPTNYVLSVIEKLKTKGITNISSSTIRNVKNKTNLRHDVLLALVEVAQENEQTIIDLKNRTT